MFKQLKEKFGVAKKRAKKPPKTLCYEELEQRVLFSADVMAGLESLAIDEQVLVEDVIGADKLAQEAAEAMVEQTAVEDQKELVFVNQNVPNYEQLIADLQKGDENRKLEVVLLEDDRDGIEQVSEILADHSDLAAVHFITHGDDGQINLGNSWLNNTTLQENIDVVAGWGNALTETGDFLFYGCNIAADSEGQTLLNNIAQLTGADVAASDDLTGNTQLGGDWELEYDQGTIETALAVNSDIQKSWVDVLATFTVNTTADTVDDNPGNGVAEDVSGNTSLRAAIMEANALGGSHEIVLSAGTYTLTGGELEITTGLTVTGAGAGVTIIDGGGIDRVFHISFGGNATITDLTIQNGGNVSHGGGIRVSGGGGGGQLNLDNVIVRNNTASVSGGGIFVDGVVTLTDVEISGNTSGDTGGGLSNDEQVTLTRVTVSGNSATDGAGIYNSNQGNLLELTNVTISGNTATANGSGIYTAELVNMTNVTLASNLGGGGIYVTGGQGDVELKNSILADNTGGNSNNSLTSLGYNIEDGNSAFTPIIGDQQNTDPLLDPLQYNGGFTRTHALQAGSTGIDPVGLSGAPPLDQRGFARDATPDIGAFEYNGIVNNPGIVTIDNTTPTQGDTLTASVSDADGATGAISYQWYRGGVAIAGATSSTYTTVQADVGSAITVTATYTDDLGSGESPTSTPTAAVTNVNDSPVALNDNLNVNEDNTITFTSATALLANDSDIDGDTLAMSGITQPANGSLVDNGDGTLTYTPDGNFYGIDSFTYSISDGNGGTANGTAMIVVAPVGDTPQVTHGSTFAEIQSGLIFINRNANDGPEVTHFKISGITNGTLYLADGVTQIADGDFITVTQGQAGLRFTPAATSVADGSFNVESSEDGISVASQSGVATSTITVMASAPPPSEPEDDPAQPDPEPDVTDEETQTESEIAEDFAVETEIQTEVSSAGSAATPQISNVQITAKPSFESGVSSFKSADFDRDDDRMPERSKQLFPQPLKMLLEAKTLGELKIALTKLDITRLSPEGYQLVRNSLDAIKEEVSREILLGKTVLGSAIATSVGLSAGYVIWMLKGGSLLASVLSSLPAWQLTDPLAILVGTKGDQDDDDESLETIIEKGSRRDGVKKTKPENWKKSEKSQQKDEII
jgi:CSLREA domain-containing protein